MTRIGCIVPFASGSARLSNSTKRDIEKSLEALGGTETILLDAYADPPGSRGLNSALTVARAETVKSYVVALGYPPHKVRMRARRDQG